MSLMFEIKFCLSNTRRFLIMMVVFDINSCIGTHDISYCYFYFQMVINDFDLIFGVFTPLSAIFQLYHGDQF
jgi:hypothetical protein